MEFNVIYTAGRCAVLETADGGIYTTKEAYQLFLNGEPAGPVQKVITPIYGLSPRTDYLAELRFGDGVVAQARFTTEPESVTLNVRDFGAAGDGIKDDTLAIQSAIMACPPQGRVLIPAGRYSFVCLFLKDGINLELEKGAELSAVTDRERFPFYPGMVPYTDQTGDYCLGTWEGDPQKMFCGLITGVHVKNVNIYGEGITARR